MLLMLVSKSRNVVIISRKNDREIVGLSKTSVSKGIKSSMTSVVVDLVRSDDELAQKLIGQAVKVLTVELGVASAFEVWLCIICN